MNRRHGARVPIELHLTEYVNDRPHRAVTTDVSESGLFVNKLIQPVRRRSRVVGLEFELPDTGEAIWARGEVRRDELDELFHGTGIAITGIARQHARLLRDYVLWTRERRYREILGIVQERRQEQRRLLAV